LLRFNRRQKISISAAVKVGREQVDRDNRGAVDGKLILRSPGKRSFPQAALLDCAGREQLRDSLLGKANAFTREYVNLARFEAWYEEDFHVFDACLLRRDPATMSRERTGFSNSQSSLATPIAISRGKRGFASDIELTRGRRAARRSSVALALIDQREQRWPDS
jgi:hypothetical protein